MAANPPQAPHIHPHDYLYPNSHPNSHPQSYHPYLRPSPCHTVHPQYNISPPPADNPFLRSLLLRTLRVTTTDGRWFVGVLKCTDKDRNLILEKTQEYRAERTGTTTSTPPITPPTSTISTTTTTTATTTTTTTTITTTTTTSPPGVEGPRTGELLVGPEGSVEISAGAGERKAGGIASRFLGLVVVPGEVIVKIEVEEPRGGVGWLEGIRRSINQKSARDEVHEEVCEKGSLRGRG